MPIGDLLASIGGGPSQPASASRSESSRPLSALVKRKATDDLRGDAPKSPRTETAGSYKGTANTPTAYTGSARPTATPRPSQASKPTTTTNSARPVNGARPARPQGATSARPAPSVAPAAVPAKAAPLKKGSYAEILARAQRAQSTMGQVGKIQHKVTDKASVKKERDDVRVDPKGAQGKSVAGKPTNGRHGAPASRPAPSRPTYAGTARPGQSVPAPRPGSLQRSNTGGPVGKSSLPSRSAAASERSSGKSKPAPPEEPKKIKRAATATTGYTGTARPNVASTKSNSKRPLAPGGALLNPRAAQRYGGSSRRSRYDEEEDEELDDFIEYDDEEEDDDPRARRYHYDSASDSDMEAGMDDIYEEERAAERTARLEDQREQALEAKLKAEKEARKRAFAQRRGG